MRKMINRVKTNRTPSQQIPSTQISEYTWLKQPTTQQSQKQKAKNTQAYLNMNLIKQSSVNDPEFLDDDLFSGNDFDDDLLIDDSSVTRPQNFKNRVTNIPRNSALEKPLLRI